MCDAGSSLKTIDFSDHEVQQFGAFAYIFVG